MDLSSLVMLGMVVTAFLGVVMGLYAVAVHLGREIEIHNLTIEAHTLRREHALRLAEMRGDFDTDGEPNFEYVDSDDEEMPIEAIELDGGDEAPMKQAA